MPQHISAALSKPDWLPFGASALRNFPSTILLQYNPPSMQTAVADAWRGSSGHVMRFHGMELARAYSQLIVWIGDTTGASDSLLHVHAGMAVFLAARLLTGRSLATAIPFAVVGVAELGNELLDLRLYDGGWSWTDTLFDILNTLFWPCVVTIGSRIKRARHEQRGRPAPKG